MGLWGWGEGLVIGDLNDLAPHCGRPSQYHERGRHGIVEHGGSVEPLHGPRVRVRLLMIVPHLGEG